MLRKPVPKKATQKPMIASAGTARPTFATPTSYVKDVDDVLEALKKAAR